MTQVPRKAQVRFLRVRGNSYERGFQHGQAFKTEIAQGVVAHLSDFIRLSAKNSAYPFLARPMDAFFSLVVRPRLERGIPSDYLQLARGLSDGSGVPLKQLLRAFTLPDAYLTMISYWEQGKRSLPVPAVPLRPYPQFGCTSAIAWGGATQDGQLYHARNFDYPAVGYFDTNPLVLLSEPTGEIPYLSIVTPGFPATGATGVNAEGISITIHQHWVTPTDPKRGVLVGIGADRVLRQARSLDQAQKILLDHPPVSGWTYLVSDKKQSIALEVAPGRHGIVRGEQEMLGYSNAYLSPEMKDFEREGYPFYWHNCLHRLHRTRELLAQGHGKHTPETLARVLGDLTDPKGGPTICGQSIPMPITIASVVLQPDAGRLWVGARSAPTSKGTFEAFSITAGGPDQAAPALQGAPFASPDHAQAYEQYVRAYLDHFEHGDDSAALSKLAEAQRALPQASELHHVHGLLSLKHGQTETALQDFKASHRLTTDPMRKAEAALFEARCHDLLGSRDVAKAGYEALLAQRPHEALAQAAQRGLTRAYRPRDARKLVIEFVFGAEIPS